jgi:hypothetical protein
MKDNKKITAGRKEMYHREENVMNMALVCSSRALFFGIIIPGFFGGGGGGGAILQEKLPGGHSTE